MPIDPEDVISLGDELMERYPDAFTNEFTENRQRVEQVTDLQSGHVRNRIAGYITRNTAETSEKSTAETPPK